MRENSIVIVQLKKNVSTITMEVAKGMGALTTSLV